MNKPTKHFIAKLRDSHLSDAEREQTRDALTNLMEQYPAEPPHVARSFGFIFSRPIVAALALLIIISIGGGTALAAEGSLPGDPLYSIKIYLNEELLDALTISPLAQAEWEETKTERRLVEAEELALNGALNEEHVALIEKQIEKHTERLSAIADELETEGDEDNASDIRTSLHATLNGHGEILIGIGTINRVAFGPELDTILDRVADEIEEVIEHQSEDWSTSIKIKTRTSVESKTGNAEKKIAEARATIIRSINNVDSSVISSAEEQLDAADELLAELHMRFDDGDFGSAFDLAQEIQRIAQQTRVMVNAASSLSLNISVEIDSDEPEDEIEIEDGSDDDEEDDASKRIENMRRHAERFRERMEERNEKREKHSEKKSDKFDDRENFSDSFDD